MARQRSAQTPDLILQAAESLIRREGASRLTIDAVAAEAGLSKGGVLHHFASKESLIAGMVKHQLGRMETELATIEEDLKPSHMAPVIALIRHARQHYGREDGIPQALLVASAESPQALEGFRIKITETLERLGGEGRGAHEAGALFFATLGILLTESLGFYSNARQANALLDTLERMAVREGREP